MFKLLTALCILLSLVVVNAQMDEDLQPAYSDNNRAYDEENVAYSDNNQSYYKEYDTNGDDYNGNDYADYDDNYIATISFSMELFKEFYSCLCLGVYHECEIHYSQEEDAVNVNHIEKTGNLQGESDICKYYMCAHVSDTHKISCVQAQKQSTAFSFGTVAQFFRLKSYECCVSTCVGLIWSNEEEQMNFFLNSSDIESCNETCLYSSGGEEEHRVTKITVSPLSTETQIDTYIIHKTQPTSNSLPTKTSTKITSSSKVPNNLAPVSLTIWQTTTASSVNSDLVYGRQNMSGTTIFEENENSKMKTIIVAVAAAISSTVVIVCIVLVIVVICRKKRQRTMKMKENKASEAESGPINNTGPELSHFRHVKVNETSPTHYSRIPNKDEVTPSILSYEHSPKVSGFSKNGVNFLDNSDIGNGDSNSLLKERTNPKSALAAETDNVALSNSNIVGKPKYNATKFHVDTDNSQGGVTNGQHSQNSGKIKEGFDSDGVNVKDRSDMDCKEADGSRSKAENTRLIIRDQDGKALTSSKDDVNSRQPLLNWPPVMESVV